MLHQKDKAILKSLHSIFCKEEEDMSKSALGVLCDGYEIEGTIVVRENGRNIILCSSILNMDRLNRLNAQIARITTRGGAVYSYDGVYNFHREYPLSLTEDGGFGAVLVENDKSFPPIPPEVIEYLSYIVRHEGLKRRVAESSLYDLNTQLKNRDGLYQVFESNKSSFNGGYVACIRLKNRTELLNTLKCSADTGLSIRITNVMLRQLKHQIYRIGVDLWAWLVPKCPSEVGEEIEEYETRTHRELVELLDCLAGEVRGAVFSIVYTDVKDEPLYSLFLAESATQNGDINEVFFVRGVNEGDLEPYMDKRRVYTGEFHQESDLYSTHWTTSSEKEEDLADVSGVYEEVDDGESLNSEKDSAVFDFSDSDDEESESAENEGREEQSSDIGESKEAFDENPGVAADDDEGGSSDDSGGEDEDGCLIV